MIIKDIPEKLMFLIGASSKIEFYNLGIWNWGLLRFLGMKPEDNLLDLGCGIGRIALADDSWHKGIYAGIDIDGEMIAWDKANIENENKKFYLADKVDYKVPYPDKTFKFIIAHSLFTHIEEDKTKNYFNEIDRLLTDDGVAYLTFFMIYELNWRQQHRQFYQKDWLIREFEKRKWKYEIFEGKWKSGYGFWNQDVILIRK